MLQTGSFELTCLLNFPFLMLINLLKGRPDTSSSRVLFSIVVKKSFIKVTTKIRDSPHTQTNSTGLIANRRYTSAQIVQSLIPSST